MKQIYGKLFQNIMEISKYILLFQYTYNFINCEDIIRKYKKSKYLLPASIYINSFEIKIFYKLQRK